jgi:hypothetical protein
VDVPADPTDDLGTLDGEGVVPEGGFGEAVKSAQPQTIGKSIDMGVTFSLAH